MRVIYAPITETILHVLAEAKRQGRAISHIEINEQEVASMAMLGTVAANGLRAGDSFMFKNINIRVT
jgi:hypothetical protein